MKSLRNAQPSWGELHEAGEEGWGPQLRMLKPGEGKAKSQVCNVVRYQRGESDPAGDHRQSPQAGFGGGG